MLLIRWCFGCDNCVLIAILLARSWWTVPPERIVILDEKRDEVRGSRIGPLHEDSHVKLICRTEGGKSLAGGSSLALSTQKVFFPFSFSLTLTFLSLIRSSSLRVTLPTLLTLTSWSNRTSIQSSLQSLFSFNFTMARDSLFPSLALHPLIWLISCCLGNRGVIFFYFSLHPFLSWPSNESTLTNLLVPIHQHPLPLTHFDGHLHSMRV